MPKHWPEHLPVVQMRIARPSGQLDRVVAFCRDAIGLPIIYSYVDDAEYDGVIFGLPGKSVNLEITRYHGDGACPITLGPIGQPTDIARACVFLASNDFATGAILRVDGGEGLAGAET